MTRVHEATGETLLVPYQKWRKQEAAFHFPQWPRTHFSIFYPEEHKRNGKPQGGLEVAQKEGRFEDEGWRIRKDGSRFWANVIITALRDQNGKLVGFGKVTRDFTERMKAQEALAKSEKSLRELSLHLLSTQDEERKRIGRDLHDNSDPKNVPPSRRRSICRDYAITPSFLESWNPSIPLSLFVVPDMVETSVGCDRETAESGRMSR